MSQLIQNFEYIAAHIKDYIDENKLFSTFEIQDIKKIMKFTTLTTNDFITLMIQSQSEINANELYTSTRKANVSIQNYEEVVSILKSLNKYMKLGILGGVVDFLIQFQKDISDSDIKIQNLQI
ncbi:hypothetical protein TVAG_493240 [Trichomonas vaginalis G3]|uniref:Uncharacterized protein n=1 Tax=Trichomonas vaginalis (strain ATCC PRA-98 / G3) TaxID=412133 RepID=A2F2D2_TRIV3|nr:EP4 subtype prostaglandin E2 receptor binding [Trichomonas vaginalis G3]EAY00951.1 hypothetical protein TVAG_493240 [Trichomonas vaginalis G3]KAI5552785.1 EP4 subtype prostaglandin E2 receptor binding [Trichomonas vaginalis G3]|eukprot:XP_001330036.1 hypothetical protein [Trichomonas vaginalis G3]